MTRLLVLACVIVGWQFGCGSKSLSPGQDGGATGGDPGTTGGSPGTTGGSSGATGGAAGATLTVGAGLGPYSGCSDIGAAPDAGLPPPDPTSSLKPCGAIPDDVPTFPWDLRLASSNPGTGGVPAGGAGGAVGAGGADALAPAATGGSSGVGGGGGESSGCQRTPNAHGSEDVTCSGAAWLRATGGGWSSSFGGAGGSNVPSVTWDDGSQLLWKAYGLYGSAPPVSPPIASGTPDQRVWVDLQVRGNAGNGVFATVGSSLSSDDLFTQQTMSIRDMGNGSIRFFAQQGTSVPDPPADQLHDILGAQVTAAPICTVSAEGSQSAVRATVFDHVVQTDPPQPLPYGQSTRVTTPYGIFEVLWFTRAQSIFDAECDGAVHQAPMVGLILSKVASP